MRQELERVDRQIRRLVDVVLEGDDAKAINAKLKELEEEKSRLASAVETGPQEEPLLPPNLMGAGDLNQIQVSAVERDGAER